MVYWFLIYGFGIWFLLFGLYYYTTKNHLQ